MTQIVTTILIFDPKKCLGEEGLKPNEEILRLKQKIADMHCEWVSCISPPPLPTNDIKNIYNNPLPSRAQFSVSVDTPQLAPGFTPHQYYPNTFNMPLQLLNKGIPPIHHHLLPSCSWIYHILNLLLQLLIQQPYSLDLLVSQCLKFRMIDIMLQSLHLS